MEAQSLTEIYAGKYIGVDKITEVLPHKGDAAWAYIFDVTYENGRTEAIPQKGFVASVSDEPSNATQIRDRKFALLVPEIIEVFRQYGVEFSQFQNAMIRVASEYQNHFNRANAILWFGNADRYAPGCDTMEMLSLNDADRVNATHPPKKDVE